MKKITTISFILFILVFVALAIALPAKNTAVIQPSVDGQGVVPSTDTSQAKDQAATPTVDTSSPSQPQLTASEVANHNSKSSCWTIVNGYVYNLTSYVYRHPGGSNSILNMCGVDASSSFSNQHGGQRRPASELASLKIGPIVR